jgi:hypothetical protein
MSFGDGFNDKNFDSNDYIKLNNNNNNFYSTINDFLNSNIPIIKHFKDDDEYSNETTNLEMKKNLGTKEENDAFKIMDDNIDYIKSKSNKNKKFENEKFEKIENYTKINHEFNNKKFKKKYLEKNNLDKSIEHNDSTDNKEYKGFKNSFGKDELFILRNSNESIKNNIINDVSFGGNNNNNSKNFNKDIEIEENKNKILNTFESQKNILNKDKENYDISCEKKGILSNEKNEKFFNKYYTRTSKKTDNILNEIQHESKFEKETKKGENIIKNESFKQDKIFTLIRNNINEEEKIIYSEDIIEKEGERIVEKEEKEKQKEGENLKEKISQINDKNLNQNKYIEKTEFSNNFNKTHSNNFNKFINKNIKTTNTNLNPNQNPNPNPNSNSNSNSIQNQNPNLIPNINLNFNKTSSFFFNNNNNKQNNPRPDSFKVEEISNIMKRVLENNKKEAEAKSRDLSKNIPSNYMNLGKTQTNFFTGNPYGNKSERPNTEYSKTRPTFDTINFLEINLFDQIAWKKHEELWDQLKANKDIEIEKQDDYSCYGKNKVIVVNNMNPNLKKEINFFHLFPPNDEEVLEASFYKLNKISGKYIIDDSIKNPTEEINKWKSAYKKTVMRWHPDKLNPFIESLNMKDENKKMELLKKSGHIIYHMNKMLKILVELLVKIRIKQEKACV